MRSRRGDVADAALPRRFAGARSSALLIGFIGASVAAAGQESPKLLRFEAASIEATAETAGIPPGIPAEALTGMADFNRSIPMRDPARMGIRHSSLLHLICLAYDVAPSAIRGPKWTGEALFDVEAKVAPGTDRAEVRQMLQSLLEERFHLSTHREAGTASGYELVVSKGGLRLRPSIASLREPPEDGSGSEAAAAALMKSARGSMGNARSRPGSIHYGYSNISAKQLAEIAGYYAGSPVADRTGLPGTYDVDLHFPNGSRPGEAIFDAVRELGLRLAPARTHRHACGGPR